MFDKLMNNYYFGKSGKGDFTPDDLPSNRWQLFLDTLRTRFSALVRLNLLYVLVWIPTIVVLVILFSGFLNVVNQIDLGDGTSYQTRQADQYLADQAAGTLDSRYTEEQIAAMTQKQPVLSGEAAQDTITSLLFTTLLLLIPCIGITGPFTAGVSYVLQHWSRDEHAFIWSDFKDALKENWKQAIVMSLITGLVPMLVYMSWTFYGQMARTQLLMTVPQYLVLMLGIIWMLTVTYVYPMIVSYQLKLKDALRNSLLLAIARLPFSLGVRLLHCVPVALGLLGTYFLSAQYVPLALLAYYLLIGYTLSRFITASYTNAVFDRFINPRIKGAPVNRGLRAPDEDDEDAADNEPETADETPAAEGTEA